MQQACQADQQPCNKLANLQTKNCYLAYLSLKIFFLMCERDTFLKSIAPTFKEKGSSSNEIMVRNFFVITGSERTLEKTKPLLHCLQGLWALFGHYFDSILSDPIF